uniref:alpha-glucosidase n=1 Tax=Percolomonas cosmopolitus TaxID=63605 RepID=A0A7S1KLE3_9EUKA
MSSPLFLAILLLAIFLLSSLSHASQRSAASSPYTLTDLITTKQGYTGTLLLKSQHQSDRYGSNLPKLQLSVVFESKTRLRVKIVDAEKSRWEVPDYIVKQKAASQKPDDSLLRVEFQKDPFAFRVFRKRATSSGEIREDIIFDTFGTEFAFKDQYLNVKTNLHYEQASKPRIFGLGERFLSFQLPTDNHVYTMFNKDNYLAYDKNLYGSHPFYMQHRPEIGASHGVLLLNSNAMDVVLSNQTLEYRTIGGVMDFFFFAGPSPKEVVQQYQQLTGLSYMPLYSTLGFHMCRYGYKNISHVRDVVQKMDQYQLPMDVQWLDIDYMRGYRLFTFDPVNFPQDEMKKFVDELKASGKHLVTIIDPGVKTDTDSYPQYQALLDSGAYVKRADGKPLVNVVWPGEVIFPDFSAQKGIEYWKKEVSQFVQSVGISGLWCDMNEIAGFVNGSVTAPIAAGRRNSEFNPNNPPYVPGGVRLDEKTVSLDATTEMGLQYNTHNLYGQSEVIATKTILEEITQKRAFVLTRSTYVGSGNYSAMWLGDNESTYYQLKLSLGGIMTMNMLGVQSAGADICGFEKNTTQELCKRWTSLGSFYPFARNHNFKDSIDQEPWALDMIDMTRRHLLNRYSLLPYFYTLFYEASQVGGNIWRPLFQLFPDDDIAADVDTEVFVGDAIMLSPVLDEGATSVSAYFPAGGIFYNYYSGKKVIDTTSSSSGERLRFECSVEDIIVHQLGGSAIVRQKPEVNTRVQEGNPYFLQIASDKRGEAFGQVYFDDGESLKEDIGDKYALFDILMRQQTIKIALHDDTQYAKAFPGRIAEVFVYGVKQGISSVSVNGEPVSDWHVNENGVLRIVNLETVLGFPGASIHWE